jgi:hypothetical protein
MTKQLQDPSTMAPVSQSDIYEPGDLLLFTCNKVFENYTKTQLVLVLEIVNNNKFEAMLLATENCSWLKIGKIYFYGLPNENWKGAIIKKI